MSPRNIGLLLAGALACAACDSYDESDLSTVVVQLPPLVTALPTVATPVEYNDLPVHDPSVVRAEDGTWYVIGSHLAMAKSSDLVTWESVADGVNDANPLFDTYATEIAEGIAWTGGHVGSWASDIIQLADGRWYFYYNHCATPDDGLCDAPRSYLGVAVADDIEGPYEDLGIFLRSGQTDTEIANGFGVGDITSFDGNVHPNVIDPALFYDKEGRLWMTYGSYSGGIFILEMDDTTGMPLPGQGYGKHLAGGFFSAIEGSYVLYSPDSDYYYLFVSFGGFEAGDGYNIRIARSRNPDGPYLDAEGKDMAQAAGNFDAIAPFGVKLMGSFEFGADVGDPTPSRGYVSPGHNSAYYDEETGRYLLVTHTRFPNRGQEHAIRVHEMFLNNDDWLVVSPHRYAPLSGDNQVGRDDVVGVYRVINHERDINREVKRHVYVSLNADGTISGDLTGTYRLSLTGGRDIRLDIAAVGTFEGVILWQWDSATERLTPTFTALSANGTALWGSQMEPLATADVLQAIADDLDLPETFQGDAIELPTLGTRGAQIAWTSDNPNVIKPDGTVIRPNVGEGDQAVGVTATIMLNGEETSVTWFVTVPQRFAFNRMAQWDFENDLAESLGNFGAGEPTGDRLWKVGLGTVAYAPGHDGQALALDGTNGVRLPDGLISNYEYSVSFWVNPSALTMFTTAFFGAVDEQQPEGGDPFSNAWISMVPQGWDGNTMLWSGSDPWFDGVTGELIPANDWSHVAFSVNRGLVKVFINGEERFSGGNLRDFFTESEGRFTLGVNYWDTPFNGMIDELKIYDAALLAGEIKALDIDHLPTEDLLQMAADLLDLGDLSDVTDDIHLPRSGPFAAAIEWTSSDPAIAVEADTGVVTRPAEGSPPADVTLTATITLDGQSTTKPFAATVRSLGPPDPLAHYAFEGTLDDAQGNFAAGTPTGPTATAPGGNVAFAQGIAGQALSLDGATGVSLGENLITDDTWSVSLWLNPSALTAFTTAFFGGSDTSWVSVVPGGLGDTGSTMLWSGTQWYDAVTGVRIPTGEWTHFAAVNDQGNVTVYLDGVALFTGSNFPDVFTPLVNPPFWIGVNHWDPAYRGLVDELKVYDIALTGQDVARLHANDPDG
ncbi:MAG TPA: LamG-like jellyroll fold domain-containing protein [Woeseiaceae bacterium]|nr:LamG-like jellyroll fold domain-containing protein [Woeseiaceae bacterium]